MQLRSIIGQSGSIISRVKLRQTTTQVGKREGIDDVGHCLCVITVSVRAKSFYRLRSALDRYGNGSEETTVVVGE